MLFRSDFGPKDQDRNMYARNRDAWLTRHYQDLYNGVASGNISVSPDQFNSLVYDLPANTYDPYSGINVNEFATLSPEVQAWARANPQAFVQDVIAHRNPDTQDMLSISDDGGYVPSSMGNVKITNGKMDWGNAQYIPVEDSGFSLASLLPLALAFVPGMQGLAVGLGDALIGSSFLSPVVGNAVIGGLTSGLTGGDPLKGAVTGGLGSFISGSNFAGDLGLTGDAAKIANAAISGGVNQLVNTGTIDPGTLAENTAIGYGSDLAGSAIGDTPETKKGASTAINMMVKSSLDDGSTGSASPLAAVGNSMTNTTSSTPYQGFFKRPSLQRYNTPTDLASLYQLYLQQKG